jgi:tetratricopeptide (TPR) repeat protein
MAYDDQDMWDSAVKHYTATREIVERIGYAEGQARVASNLGEVYLAQGRLAEAKEQYRDALNIVERIGMTYGTAVLHNNLGAAYWRGRQWHDAELHLRHALDLFEEIGSEDFLAELFRHRAVVSLGKGQNVRLSTPRSTACSWKKE